MSGVFLDQCSDQAQQFLLFWTIASAQEGRKVLMFHMPARGRIGFVMDEQNP
ncbi:hypothetical protein [Microvirga sp. BSC39]|uniref:hypothetical protein n=1 Tax=Microvirga sp. BSC39 TaxID=1549810 RepID=UPI000B20A15F|nr:hypothetical protein [Microvirga sp. BSC39]